MYNNQTNRFRACFALGMLALTLPACESVAPAGSKPATAKVMFAAEGNCAVTDDGASCFKLSLNVYPLEAQMFRTELTANVKNQWTSRVQPGSWITVLVDPQVATKVYLDDPSFSLPAPTPPASAMK
jgi:hypothetical protein